MVERESNMMLELIIDQVLEIMCENVDEPAGRGCGYGITEEGQEEIAHVMKEFYFKEHEMTQTATVREDKKFEASITERTEDLHEGSGVLKRIKRKVLMHREPIIAQTEAAARTKAIRKFTKRMTDEDAEVCIDRLEVEVFDCTFRG